MQPESAYQIKIRQKHLVTKREAVITKTVFAASLADAIEAAVAIAPCGAVVIVEPEKCQRESPRS